MSSPDSGRTSSSVPQQTGPGDLEPVGQRDLDADARNHAGDRALEIGEEVLITGGIFEGQTGVVEGVLPSGKLRVAVETRRSLASARVDPTHLERLGIRVEGAEEID